MTWAEAIHERYVAGRRLRVLSRHLAELVPRGSRVLDVGCGDGRLARALGAQRPDVEVRGVEVRVRTATAIPVAAFDGRRLPYADRSFDAVLLVDVLHHAAEPLELLREAARVAARAVILKDHLLEGPWAGPTLRFMDRVGNARHGVALPYHYWRAAQWRHAIAEVGWHVAEWRQELGLYPIPLRWVFERSLHFVALLHPGPTTAEDAPPSTWEAAYLRFQTPEQEIAKFQRRLRRLGADAWPREAAVVELCCGRGNGLHALSRLGFTHVEGVDLSPRLLARYHGPASCLVADCRRLPLPTGSRDVVIVQGGLHHLHQLPEDLEQTLREVHRVLRADGRFLVVEPWRTPFLDLAHWLCSQRWARRCSGKVDALAEMIDQERPTYLAWLEQPALIRGLMERYFRLERWHIGWGKLEAVGRKRAEVLTGASG
ncbi:MAG: methyltransferase domain-containing protein [Gemmataceae bacterium]|nr:methyltransferase domain-containing protein [Gemmataceae bacterium]MDW8265139.1 methyltransferase domain-containing protein [Gemmataceae bacterium]